MKLYSIRNLKIFAISLTFSFFLILLQGANQNIWARARSISANIKWKAKTTNRQNYQKKVSVPKVSSAAVISIDYDDTTIYFNKNAFQQRSIASLTKLMAMLVLSETNFDPFTIYTIPRHYVKPYYKTRLKTGMQVTAMDLLHSALLGSDNVATLCLVDVSGLTQEEFVRKMNDYARRLNLTMTRFADPTGYEPGNVSCAFEVTIMLKKILENQMIYRIMNTKQYKLIPLNSYNPVQYVNTNRLLQNPSRRTFGGKTGFISVAGYCLATANTLSNGKKVITVCLGANGKLTRFGDAVRVLDWLDVNINRLSEPAMNYFQLSKAH